MASDLDNLTARRSSIYAELAALTSTANGGKPTYNIDGEMVDHVAYRKSLYDELTMLNQAINIAQGPFEILGQATT